MALIWPKHGPNMVPIKFCINIHLWTICVIAMQHFYTKKKMLSTQRHDSLPGNGLWTSSVFTMLMTIFGQKSFLNHLVRLIMFFCREDYIAIFLILPYAVSKMRLNLWSTFNSERIFNPTSTYLWSRVQYSRGRVISNYNLYKRSS